MRFKKDGMLQTFQELLWVTAETNVLRAATAVRECIQVFCFFFLFPNASSKYNESFMHSLTGQIYGWSYAFDEELPKNIK